MSTAGVVARWRESDYGASEKPNNYIDEEVIEHADAAFRASLKFVEDRVSRYEVDIGQAGDLLRLRLFLLSKAYWTAYDYDHRYRLVHFRGDAGSFIAGLKHIKRANEKSSSFFNKALDKKLRLKLGECYSPENLDHFFKVNNSLLEICLEQVEVKAVKNAQSRCHVVMPAIASLWMEIFQQPFKGRSKRAGGMRTDAKGNSLTDAKGRQLKQFTSDAAQFAWVVLGAISDGTATQSQIQTAYAGFRKNSRASSDPSSAR